MNGRFLTVDKAPAGGASVLVAMSGGVDSAVTALLLKEAGYEAVGLTMKNYCYGDADVPDRSCCSVEAIGDAKRECDRLGMPHRVADVEEFFTREVIDDFLGEYENARTPNPCVRCNGIVRFQTLVDYADRIGVDYVATGHYARVFETARGGRFLARAINRRKDQSYFLSAVTGDVLERVLFPLGDYETKDSVRNLASGAAMSVADKKESQEVCFVPDGTLRSFLESRDVPLVPGPIETTDGEVIGKHTGLAAYTVGQRRHLGIATGEPRYVVALDRARNAVIVGGNDDLMTKELRCRLTWIDREACGATDADGNGAPGPSGRRPAPITAQIRYRHEGATVARVDVNGRGARVEFAEPQRAIAPGQTVAFYAGPVVVGSGVIE
jgi:tRNA-specific 2-thiouridylase